MQDANKVLSVRSVGSCRAIRPASPIRKMTGPAALVIGSEGFGMGRLVSEQCDFTVGIPLLGKITSLNASAAAAILLYESVRQRLGQ